MRSITTFVLFLLFLFLTGRGKAQSRSPIELSAHIETLCKVKLPNEMFSPKEREFELRRRPRFALNVDSVGTVCILKSNKKELLKSPMLWRNGELLYPEKCNWQFVQADLLKELVYQEFEFSDGTILLLWVVVGIDSEVQIYYELTTENTSDRLAFSVAPYFKKGIYRRYTGGEYRQEKERFDEFVGRQFSTGILTLKKCRKKLSFGIEVNTELISAEKGSFLLVDGNAIGENKKQGAVYVSVKGGKRNLKIRK